MSRRSKLTRRIQRAQRGLTVEVKQMDPERQAEMLRRVRSLEFARGGRDKEALLLEWDADRDRFVVVDDDGNAICEIAE